MRNKAVTTKRVPPSLPKFLPCIIYANLILNLPADKIGFRILSICRL